MEKTHSTYKLFGGFGLILILFLWPLIPLVLTFLDFSGPYPRFNEIDGLASKVSIFMLLLSVPLLTLVTQSKRIVADDQGITFINPLLPFLRKRYAWQDFEYFILVDEESRGGAYEAIWLMKNEKIEARISSYYYQNYEEIKDRINVYTYGKKRVGSFSQFLMIIKLKKLTTEDLSRY